MKPQDLYFDYAAATPLDPQVQKAMAPFWNEHFYNPSAIYQPARQVKQALEDVRASVAQLLNAKASEVIFTAGATESINMAIQGVLRANPGKVIVGAGEHEAVTAAAHLAANRVAVCPLKPNGVIDLAKLERLIDRQTVLVSIQYANNETGVIQPIAQIAKLIAAKRAERRTKFPLYFHSDASQAPNYLAVAVNRLGVDMLSLNGSKIYGPKYSGCLYLRTGTTLQPLIVGGGQERGLRGGTENVAGAIGFARALEIAARLRQSESSRLAQLQSYLLRNLEQRIPGIKLNAAAKPRLPNNINVSIQGVNGETLVHYLNQAGILVATGAACNANKDAPSATLVALGLSAADIDSSLRITLGRSTSKSQVNKLLSELKRVVRLLRQQ